MILTHLLLLFIVGVATVNAFTLLVKPTDPGDLLPWFARRVENAKAKNFRGHTLDICYDGVGGDESPSLCAQGSSPGGAGDPKYIIGADGKLYSLPGIFRSHWSADEPMIAGIRQNFQASNYPKNKIMYRLEFFTKLEINMKEISLDPEIKLKGFSLMPRFDIEVLTKWRYQEVLENAIAGTSRSFLLGLEQEGASEVLTQFYLCQDDDGMARLYHVIIKGFFHHGITTFTGCQQVNLEITWLSDEREEDSTDEEEEDTVVPS